MVDLSRLLRQLPSVCFVKLLVFTVLFLVLWSNTADGMEPGKGSFFHPSNGYYYESNSGFTRIPAYTGFAVSYPLGYLLLYPVGLSCSRPPHYWQGAHQITIFLNNRWGAYWGYLLVGAPFWALETTFWTGPCWLYDAAFGDDDEVDPRDKVSGRNHGTADD